MKNILFTIAAVLTISTTLFGQNEVDFKRFNYGIEIFSTISLRNVNDASYYSYNGIQLISYNAPFSNNYHYGFGIHLLYNINDYLFLQSGISTFFCTNQENIKYRIKDSVEIYLGKIKAGYTNIIFPVYFGIRHPVFNNKYTVKCQAGIGLKFSNLYHYYGYTESLNSNYIAEYKSKSSVFNIYKPCKISFEFKVGLEKRFNNCYNIGLSIFVIKYNDYLNYNNSYFQSGIGLELFY